ncbi:amidase [Nonomuraea sp. NPDC002799]
MTEAPLHALLARHGGLAGLAAAVRDGTLPPAEPARAALSRIAALNPSLHAFTQVFTEPGPGLLSGALAGIPVAVKDNIDVASHVTSLGRPLQEYEPAPRDAVAVARLKAADAFVAGKTNLPELASSAVTANAHYGDARNPCDESRTAGGSSGGSASAVAAGMAAAALGTDTGGSVLIPAALTGVCGFRPTHGRISVDGVVPLSPTFDTVGVIALTPADVTALLNVLEEPAPPPGVLLEEPAPPPAAPGLAGLRVGRLTGWFDEIDGGVRDLLDGVAGRLAAAGAQVSPVELPSAPLVHRHARTIYAVEASAVYAGLLQPGRSYPPTVEARRGHRVRPEDLDRAREFRRMWQAETNAAFARFDVLLTATTPIVAPPIDGATEETTTALIRQTYPFCLAGTPAVSLPAGTLGGLPAGALLAAAAGADHRLLAVASACHLH